MTLPLQHHPYGEHDAVPPPGDLTRHDSASVDLDTRLHLYRRQQEVRQFEKRAYDLFMRQLGQGVSRLAGDGGDRLRFGVAMRADDYTFGLLDRFGPRRVVDTHIAEIMFSDVFAVYGTSWSTRSPRPAT